MDFRPSCLLLCNRQKETFAYNFPSIMNLTWIFQLNKHDIILCFNIGEEKELQDFVNLHLKMQDTTIFAKNYVNILRPSKIQQ